MGPARVGRGELIAAVAGVVLFGVMLVFDWFSVEVGIQADLVALDTGRNAFQAFALIDLVLLLTVIVTVGLAVLSAAAPGREPPLSRGVLTAGLGGISTLLVLYRILNPPDALGREIGIFIGLIACAAIAYGGWVSLREEGRVDRGGRPPA